MRQINKIQKMKTEKKLSQFLLCNLEDSFGLSFWVYIVRFPCSCVLQQDWSCIEMKVLSIKPWVKLYPLLNNPA